LALLAGRLSLALAKLCPNASCIFNQGGINTQARLSEICLS
jgi:hypothetical protein